MALERRNPLPPGRYSIFIHTDEESRWADWLREHRDTVRLLISVPKRVVASNTAVFSVTFTTEIIQNYIGRIELFDVSADTPWVELGYPDIQTGVIPEQFARRELDPGVTCYWVWTESGPEVVCDKEGPKRISLPLTVGPWVLAAFLGWVFINRRSTGKRASSPAS